MIPSLYIPQVETVEELRQSVVAQLNNLVEQLNRPATAKDLDMKGYRLYNVRTPSNDLDVVNKKYVDALVRDAVARVGGGRQVSSTIAYSAQIANTLSLTLTSNTTISAPITASDGLLLIIFVKQGTSPYTISFDAADFAQVVNTSIPAVADVETVFPFIGRADGLWWPMSFARVME